MRYVTHPITTHLAAALAGAVLFAVALVASGVTLLP
jgi:hypothetical protein